MYKSLPKLPALKREETEIANLGGMNDTTHPTLLPLNIPSNLQNSYFQNGVLDKRNGYAKFGSSLTDTITETFDATTKKDATDTTGYWSTTGTAKLNAETVTENFSATTNKDATTDFYSESNYNGTIFEMCTSNYTRVGQSFTGDGKVLETCEFYLCKSGLITGNAVAKLYVHSGTYGTSSVPDTLLATSDNFDVSMLTTSFGLKKFTFSTPYTLVNGTKYCIEIDYSGGDSSNEILVGGDYPSPTHSGNSFTYDAYNSIQYLSNYDLTFYINKATTADWNTTQGKLLLNLPAETLDQNDIETTLFGSWGQIGQLLGQTFTPTTTKNLSKIICKFGKYGSPTDNIYMEIYATSSGIPTGSVLYTSNQIVGSTLSEYNSTAEVTFNFTSAPLTANTMYAFVLRRTIPNTTDRYTYHGAAVSEYTGGTMIVKTTSWSIYGDGEHAFYFKEYYTGYDTTNNIGQSLKLNTIANVDFAKLTATATTPTGTSLVYQISNDGGSTWTTTTSGTTTAFASTGTDFRFKVTLNGTTTATPYVETLAFDLLDNTNNVVQSTAYDALGTTTYQVTPTYTLNGGTVVFEYSSSANGSTAWDAWTADITTLTKRYMRFRLTITSISITTPTVETIVFAYSGIPIISSHSWTKPGTTEKYLLVVGSTFLYMYYSDGNYHKIKTNLTTGLRTTATGFSEASSSSSGYFVITNGTDNVMRFNGKVSTGTITTSGAGNRTVTNSGTSKWKTVSNADEVAAGGSIKIGAVWYTIDSVTSDTVLVLSTDGASVAGSAYEIYSVPDLAGLATASITGGVLKGKYVASYKSQLMIGGITGHESIVQVSQYMTGITWSYSADSNGNFIFQNGSGAIDISTNDGQIITALVPFGNSVQVHKSDIYHTKRSVYSLTRSTDVWTNYPVSTQYAAVSQYAVTVAPNAVYFIDTSGIVITNGVTFNKLDNDIANTTSTFNQTYINNAIAAYNVQDGNEFLFFGVPIGSSVTNNYLLMYDQQNKGWGIMTGMNMGCFAIYSDVYTPELYFGDQLASSQIIKWNSGTSDNGQPIEWTVETAELSMKQYFERKKFKYLYGFFEPTGAYTVHAYYSLNGGAYVELTDTVTVSGSTDVFKRWALPGLTGSTVKFKFYNYEKDQPITLVRCGVVTVDKGLRRI